MAVAALIGITLAFYHGLWLRDLVLIKRDAFRYFLPLKQYVIERLMTGELPQWFPYEAAGCPFIGVSGIGVFHPFTVLYFLFPVPDAYRASTLLSCVLAALGAFALGRMLSLSRAGSLTAGVSFALSGYVVSLTDNLLYLYSICLLPLFCAALEKALVRSRTWVVAPAVLWATVFLIGDIQTGYYYFFIALAWTIARAPGSRREAGLRLAIISGIAALLAGIQLGPAWAVFTNTERMQPALFQEPALHWSTPPLRLVTIVASPGLEQTTQTDAASFFFGVRPTISGVGGGLWAESLYLGIPVMGLALLGAWQRRDLRVLALMGSVALLLALGRYGGLYALFYHALPLWSAFRYPEKFMGFVSFSAAILAGAGLDTLRKGPGRSWPWLAAALVCAGAGFALHAPAAVAWTMASYGAPEAMAREVADSAGHAFLYSTCAALGVWVILLGAKRETLRAEFLLACLVAIITFDLVRANLGAYHTAPAEAATFVPPLAQALIAREGVLGPGRFRLFAIPEETFVLPPALSRQFGTDGAVSVERRQALDMEHNAQLHLETFNAYLSAYRSSFRTFLQLKLGVAGAARYNVAYYTGHRGRWKDPQFANTMVAELPEFRLALFQSSVPPKPRAYLSQAPERAAAPVAPAALLARPDFLNGELDVIETTEPLPGPAFRGHAVIERYAPEDVRVRVETPQPAVLILLDAFDQGWTATLEDGIEVPIRRANALVRAVVVPAGVHMITFRYETPLLCAGVAASLFGVLLSLLLIVRARRRAYRGGPVP